MKAQTLYDLREQFGFCSGDEMHSFFSAECNGEPSPSGTVEVDTTEARKFIRSSLDRMARNNGGTLDNLYTADELGRLYGV
jgi:hypothetical protein